MTNMTIKTAGDLNCAGLIRAGTGRGSQWELRATSGSGDQRLTLVSGVDYPHQEYILSNGDLVGEGESGFDEARLKIMG